MVDRPVDRVERHRDEGVYSARIERDKKGKEKFSDVPPRDDKQILFATFFSYLRRLFDNFSPSKELAGKVVDRQLIIENLKEFRKLLEALGKQDLSTSAEFATELSDVWCLLLEDFDNIEIIERKDLKQVASFREMMDTVKNYPPDSDHHFGYYLLQHAGKDWLPFPFIEMLETLHKEHVEDPKTGALVKWFVLLDGVIENLRGGLPFNP